VLPKENKLIPIEAKYKSKVKKEDLKGLLYFMKKFNIPKGYVITKDLEGFYQNIEFVPFRDLENIKKISQ